MSIKNLNFDQVCSVSGGSYSPTLEQAHEELGDKITNIIQEENMNKCLGIVYCGFKYFIRCIPEQKPEDCSNDVWEKLHIFDGGVIRKCNSFSENSLIKK
jgi:hypothetical protein